jgi:cytochrome oxidase Cu insertion factor (SCO1/SenC/PrrC family)
MSAPRYPAATGQRRQRQALIGLALLFFAPLGLAFFLYYGAGWRPGGHVNHGVLIDPPRPLPAVALPRVDADSTAAAAERLTAPDFLTHKWTLLYWGAGACSDRCKTDLYNTRQVRIALNRDMDRVQRVFVAQGTCCDSEFLREQHPDLITVRATPDAAPILALLRLTPADQPATADRVYLIDPLGNVMMFYAPDARPKGMLEDLKRLLGLSHVG